MISGVGVDIVEISRIREAVARHGKSFLKYLYPEAEIPLVAERPAEFHAGRFAAKEAVAKALGCGFGKDCLWREIVIVNDAAGRPRAELSGAALETFRKKADALHLSISHEKSSAVAVAVLERTKPCG